MTRRKLRSRKYRKLMRQDWDMRHTEENQKEYGVWRWLGMYEHRHTIIGEIAGRKTIDFGGALGPLGFGSEICDQAERDINGNKVIWRDLKAIPDRWANVFFSSHALEHVEDFPRTMYDIYRILTTECVVILHLPSDRNAKHWHPARRKEHKRLFTLEKKIDLAYVNPTKLFPGYSVWADYCGDASIILVAHR